MDEFKKISNDVPVTKVEGRTFPIEVIEKNGEDHIAETEKLYKQGKSILIFESGKGEIERTINGLKMQLGDDVDIIPFHSEISKEELEESLKTTGKQKIIVATNAARTGVTLDINSVVDIGKQKTQYYNDFGIPVLVTENITKDAYMQNRGRAGRKEDGTAVYVGGTVISELKEEAPSSIEKKLDEKKILTELAFGTNILENELNGNHKYIFNPSKKMLKLSYEWMKQVGLMTKDEKITKYGYDVLRFPLSVFNGRILLESIENGVASDIIPMISIIENKGFLTKEFNAKKFGKNILKREYSDLEVYTKLLEILTSKEVDEDILKMFIGLGIKPGTIDYFRSIQGEEKFYKVLGKELEEVGFKLKNIERIDETIEKIQLYLESNEKYQESSDLEIGDEERKTLIQKSLLSGNLHNIYTSV
ncbi:MAG: helicase-related protein [Candidatus Gracilibacteria bacterium]|nr:helicase-related protein [Candidatus Gracilibacteria bacterium]